LLTSDDGDDDEDEDVALLLMERSGRKCHALYSTTPPIPLLPVWRKTALSSLQKLSSNYVLHLLFRSTFFTYFASWADEL